MSKQLFLLKSALIWVLLFVLKDLSGQAQTCYWDLQKFSEVFANTGIVVNARIVGDSAEVARQVRKLWTPESETESRDFSMTVVFSRQI